MGLKAMLFPSPTFYKKLVDSSETGFSRIEVSHYFRSSASETEFLEGREQSASLSLELDDLLAKLNKVDLAEVSCCVSFAEVW